MAKKVEFKPQMGEEMPEGARPTEGMEKETNCGGQDCGGRKSEMVGMDAKTQQMVMEAVERANADAGYDVAMAYAALNALRVNEQVYINIPMMTQRAHMMALADIVLRAHGGNVTTDVLAMIMDVAVAYGWHYAKDKEALLMSYRARNDIRRFVNESKDLMIVDKEKKREALDKGFKELSSAVKKMWAMLNREMRERSNVK